MAASGNAYLAKNIQNACIDPLVRSPNSIVNVQHDKKVETALTDWYIPKRINGSLSEKLTNIPLELDISMAGRLKDNAMEVNETTVQNMRLSPVQYQIPKLSSI